VKNKRPINQRRLRMSKDMRVLNDAFQRIKGSMLTITPAFSGFSAALRATAHDFHPKPCYCQQPRKVATALRRRDRKRGVVREHPWRGLRETMFVLDEVRHPPLMANAGLVYMGRPGAFPHVSEDLTVTWLDPEGVETAEPIGTIAEGEA
jgi:hypothetical protein